MSDFIYGGDGRVQGFRIGYFLYDRDGKPVGRVSAERVYRFDGTYVGEMFRNMVVQKPVGARPNLPPTMPPPDAVPPAMDSSRGSGGHDFADVFHRLWGPEETMHARRPKQPGDWFDE